MQTETKELIKKKIRMLSDAVEALQKNTGTSADFKKVSAPLGIYEQRNGKFMMRIRIPGGEVSLGQARFIIANFAKYGIENLHITTRQDLQMHDVNIESLVPIAQDFLGYGMPFYGGGGDTFRNITACPHGIFDKKSVFDTVPYAKVLSDYLMDYRKAFELPRKFKIAFSCSDEDYSMAKFTDLGFIAKIASGETGFEVYSGGGMGRESFPGTKIFDFVRTEEIFRVAVAAVDFFYEHGNRSDRAHARLRFVLRDKGEKFFREQFLKYFEKASGSSGLCDIPKAENSPEWKNFARLFIPGGNLSSAQFAKIADKAEKCGAKFLRFSQEQDLFVGPMDENCVSDFKDEFPEFAANNAVGLVKSCVGAKVCKIGLLDASSHARAVSLKLDEIISKLPEDEKRNWIERIESLIKISGCHNSCGLNRTAKFGFQGCRKQIDGKLHDYYIFQANGSRQNGIIAENSGIEIPANELPEFVSKLIQKEIK